MRSLGRRDRLQLPCGNVGLGHLLRRVRRRSGDVLASPAEHAWAPCESLPKKQIFAAGILNPARQNSNRKENAMDFDFTPRELLKILVVIIAVAIVGIIVYFAVAIVPDLFSEIVNKVSSR